MFGIRDLPLFIAAGLLLNATPGADTLYILRRSAAQGFRGGCLAALGISAGCFVHIAAAALGISALLLASETAFTTIKVVGALYLLYLGLSLLRSRQASSTEGESAPPGSQGTKIFLQGFLTNVLNPKVALFFLAFLPQFIESGAINKSAGICVLGLIFVCNGTLWNILVAFAASTFSTHFDRAAPVRTWLNRTAGAMFIYFGIRLSIAVR